MLCLRTQQAASLFSRFAGHSPTAVASFVIKRALSPPLLTPPWPPFPFSPSTPKVALSSFFCFRGDEKSAATAENGIGRAKEGGGKRRSQPPPQVITTKDYRTLSLVLKWRSLLHFPQRRKYKCIFSLSSIAFSSLFGLHPPPPRLQGKEGREANISLHFPSLAPSNPYQWQLC